MTVEEQTPPEPPTAEKVNPNPPSYTEDESKVKRSEWAIDGRVPVAIMGKWIKTKNLARDLAKNWGLEPYQINKELFIDNYEEAAQMYREQARAYNEGT